MAEFSIRKHYKLNLMLSLAKRISCAERYYSALSELHFESIDEWTELLNKYLSDEKYGLPEILVLIHPDWYQTIKIPDPRGNRSFATAEMSAKCRSHEFYGYECPFVNAPIHIDHQFPYSKGGVTNHANAMYLCKEHNLSKSTDIHIIDWEGMDKSWVDMLLQAFTHEVERRTHVKFPKFNKAIERV